MITSALFKHNYYATAHVVVNQGGTSSGKTYAILQVLFCRAAQQQQTVVTVVGQDIPNLKAGALRDALNIYHHVPVLQKVIKSYNRTNRVFEFNNGSLIEFNSYDDSQDAKSGKRDYLFINEANGIPWDVYTELSLRTKEHVYIDYNPNTKFWVHDNLLGRPGVQLIVSDHRHNPFLTIDQRNRIEALKDVDYELWKVYARGLTGRVAGLIFTNWHICEAIPPIARRVACGLDFGFTNDQTGCLEVFMQDGQLWVNELFYSTGLTNPDIARKLADCGVSKRTQIIADCADPKSIEELYRMGWNMVKSDKGADSVNLSIDVLKRYRINITRSSANLLMEISRYKWQTDRNGKTLNQPVDKHNHLIDPLRYVAFNKLRTKGANGRGSRLPWREEAGATEFQTMGLA